MTWIGGGGSAFDVLGQQPKSGGARRERGGLCEQSHDRDTTLACIYTGWAYQIWWGGISLLRVWGSTYECTAVSKRINWIDIRLLKQYSGFVRGVVVNSVVVYGLEFLCGDVRHHGWFEK